MRSPAPLADLPPAAATVLEEFLSALTHSLGADLTSVILFGSGAEGRLRATSDLNVLVVAERFSPEQLDGLRGALRAGHAASRLTVMFLEHAELPAAAEAFGVKFSDIKARHRVLFGTAVLDEIAVSRTAALRRVQQVVLNLHVRLRERFVLEGDHEEQLELILADAVGPIRGSAATLLAIRDGRSLAPKIALETLFADSHWSGCLEGLSRVHRGETLATGGARTLFGEVLILLATLGEIAQSC